MLQAMGNGKGEDSCSHNKAVNESSQSYGSASGLTRSHRKAQTARSGPWGLSETQRPWMWLIWEVQWQWGAAMTSRSSKDFQESVCVRIHTHTHTPQGRSRDGRFTEEPLQKKRVPRDWKAGVGQWHQEASILQKGWGSDYKKNCKVEQRRGGWSPADAGGGAVPWSGRSGWKHLPQEMGGRLSGVGGRDWTDQWVSGKCGVQTSAECLRLRPTALRLESRQKLVLSITRINLPTARLPSFPKHPKHLRSSRVSQTWLLEGISA